MEPKKIPAVYKVLYMRFEVSEKTPALVEWFIKRGVVREERQSVNLVILLIILVLSLTLLVHTLFQIGTSKYIRSGMGTIMTIPNRNLPLCQPAPLTATSTATTTAKKTTVQ